MAAPQAFESSQNQGRMSWHRNRRPEPVREDLNDLRGSNRRLGFPERKQGVTALELASFPIATLAINDHEQFPDRESVIRFLVAIGWPKKKVARIFSVTDRTIRRQTTLGRLAAHVITPPPPSVLTRQDVAHMRQDYLADPYISSEDREAALAFLDSACPTAPG